MTIIPLKLVFSNFCHFVLYFPSSLDDAAWLGSSVSKKNPSNAMPIDVDRPGV